MAELRAEKSRTSSFFRTRPQAGDGGLTSKLAQVERWGTKRRVWRQPLKSSNTKPMPYSAGFPGLSHRWLHPHKAEKRAVFLRGGKRLT